MDVESSSLNNTAGITRRNQAIAMTEAWATANGIPLQIQYTIPVEQYGLDPNGESCCRTPLPTARWSPSVNIMTFDYYIAGEGVVNMGQAAINAATNTHTQLTSIYPSQTGAYRSGTWKAIHDDARQSTTTPKKTGGHQPDGCADPCSASRRPTG